MPKFLLRFAYLKFEKKYNEFFNIKKENKLADDWYVLRLRNTVNNYLPALYYGILYGNDDEIKERFKNKFGKYPETAEDLNMIVKEIDRLLDMLKVLDSQTDNEDGIGFSELVALIENSRGIPINRDITLWDFKQIHDIEVKKWQQQK